MKTTKIEEYMNKLEKSQKRKLTPAFRSYDLPPRAENKPKETTTRSLKPKLK